MSLKITFCWSSRICYEYSQSWNAALYNNTKQYERRKASIKN